MGEPEDGGGQTDKEKGGSTGGTDGIWNLRSTALGNLRAVLFERILVTLFDITSSQEDISNENLPAHLDNL